MTRADTRTLDSRTLADTRDLVWLARQLAQGATAGVQQSRRRGAGMEFQQYRSYEPGDPIRQIDWKLYARSDRYYVRESEQDSQTHICFVLDTSASMGQASFAQPKLDKLQYARAWIATLAWILNRQGDQFSLLALNSEQMRRVPAGNGEQHHRNLCLALAGLAPDGVWPGGAQLDRFWGPPEAPALIVLISDFFEEHDEISALAHRLKVAGRDCLPVQLLVEAETSFPFRGAMRVRDPESPQRQEIDAAAQREAYLQAFSQAQRRLSQRLAKAGMPLTTLEIEQPMAPALRQFVSQHGRIM